MNIFISITGRGFSRTALGDVIAVFLCSSCVELVHGANEDIVRWQRVAVIAHILCGESSKYVRYKKVKDNKNK